MAFPTTPNDGDTTTINSVLYTYVGSKNAWIRLAPIITITTTGAITVAATAPTLTINDQGHIWINSSTDDQYVLIPNGNSTQWKELIGSGINGATGPIGPSGDDGCLFPDLGATGATGATGLIPAISTIVVTDQYWEPLPYANSVDINGGYIRITGVGFLPNCRAFVGQYITATTYIKETEVGAIVPALPTGFYTGYLVNPGGGTAELVDGIHCHPLPQWVTTSQLPATKALVPTNIQLNVTAATNFRMASGSSLPTGLTLQQHGLINGTVPPANATQTITYNFTVVATDAELQDAPKALSLVVAPIAGVEWTSNIVPISHNSSIRAVVYSPEREEYVAILIPQTNSSYPQAILSTDGLNWTKITGYPMGGDFPWPHAPLTWNSERNEYITYYDYSHVVVGQGSSWTKSNTGPYLSYYIAWNSWLGKYISSGVQLRQKPSTFTPILGGTAVSVVGDTHRFITGNPITGTGTSGSVRSAESGIGVTASMIFWDGTYSGPYPAFVFGLITGGGSIVAKFDVYNATIRVSGRGIVGGLTPGDSLAMRYEESLFTWIVNGEEVYSKYAAPGQALSLYYRSGGSYTQVGLYVETKGYYAGTMYSNDGVNWVNSDLMPSEWGAVPIKCVIVRQDTGQTLALGLSGKGATSDDGITWEYHRQPISAYSGVWGDGKYVIGGSGGLLASSSDGINWVTLVGLRDSTPWGNNIIRDINWNGSQFIVVGVAGRTAISSDCFNWTYTGGWTEQSIYSVTWNGTTSTGGPAYMVSATGGTIGISK